MVAEMNTPEEPDLSPPRRLRILRWVTVLLLGLVYGVGPWALSLLTFRYGWAMGRPGLWNLLGLIPVLLGSSGLIWAVSQHFVHAPEGVEVGLTQKYLLKRGPYAFTRHPMYLSELGLLFGWAVFYGSIAVSIAFLVACVAFQFGNVPLEERALEARFGEAYRDYKATVPRWFGKTRG
jgi:protein-S-isoprenylcysteine O-methyltransferase Ste14